MGYKKKILLITPPFYRLMGSQYNGIQLGLCYIASMLKTYGHEVAIYNTDYKDGDHYLNQRQLFENYSSYRDILNNIKHPIWQEIRETIGSFSPDIVGISMYTATFKSAKNIAQIVRQIDNDVKVVVGGTHPTLDPNGTIVGGNFDYVIRGEGEYTFLELVEGKDKRNILGLTYINNGQIIHNLSRPFISELDSLPFPDRDSHLNAANHLDVGSVITGRGCPFTCTYCASPQIWNRETRLRSVENIIEEIKILEQSDLTQPLYFVDDTFSLNKRRTKAICTEMIKNGFRMKWKCDTRADCLDRELLTLMQKAGCIRVKIGVETGSDRILKRIKKGLAKEKIRKTVALIKEVGIPLTIYLMAGFPGETNEDLKETIEFAKELDAEYYSLSILAPYYGTEIYRELKEKGKLSGNEHWEYFFHQSGDMIVNDQLDSAVVNEFLALNEREGKGERV